jgi:hypothetical protein
MQTIQFFRRQYYGNDHEYMQNVSDKQREAILYLTKRPTLSPAIRQAITDLTQGEIQWQEVVAPR